MEFKRDDLPTLDLPKKATSGTVSMGRLSISVTPLEKVIFCGSKLVEGIHFVRLPLYRHVAI